MTLNVESYDEISPAWFAIDQSGHVGAFSTTKCPLVFSEGDLRQHKSVEEYVARALEPNSTYGMDADLSRFRQRMYDGLPNPDQLEALGLHALEKNFSFYAQRGIFSFCPAFKPDHTRVATYFRVFRSKTPIHIDVVESPFRETIRRIQFQELKFEKVRALNVITGAQVE